jgi:uncharacterized protein with beta-barrel porin domain
VYEFYTRSNNFQARFVGTGVYGTFSQKNPTSNYARLGAGIVGTHKKFSYRLAYDGLFGKRFIEQSASLKLGYTF